MNQLLIPVVGNLVDDPEVRFTPSGDAVARFTIAHNPRHLDRQSGEWKDGEPTFFQCSAWRYLAENIAESLKKGHRVIAIGTLKTRRWQSDGRGKTPEGETISSLTLEISAIGPELSFATTDVKKMTRTRRGETAPDDPWATGARERPANSSSSSFDDEPPF